VQEREGLEGPEALRAASAKDTAELLHAQQTVQVHHWRAHLAGLQFATGRLPGWSYDVTVLLRRTIITGAPAPATLCGAAALRRPCMNIARRVQALLDTARERHARLELEVARAQQRRASLLAQPGPARCALGMVPFWPPALSACLSACPSARSVCLSAACTPPPNSTGPIRLSDCRLTC
jgi:hypothetical protein